MPSVESIEVTTGASPVGSVIWLHGLGADGHDFEPIVPELRLPESMPLRFVFPHAPVRPVTVNGGMKMRAWYDIKSLDGEGRADEEGIRASSAILDSLVEREIERGIASDKIVIAGFSQGGAIALHNAIRTAHSFAGLMALSAYLPLPKLTATEVTTKPAAGHTSLPIFMAHGTMDPMVPHAAGVQSRDALVQLGYSVDWHEYPMAHSVCPQEIADIRQWLLDVYEAS
ncbi:MAG: dienelactone hydrolase family protein [Gammaproteobacteria bacterium]|nr:dienelactone hydrolase family protein [Gammaproteobacteria bacterium]NNC76358.1 carboxylesterase [Woeseiaceae bacterium]